MGPAEPQVSRELNADLLAAGHVPPWEAQPVVPQQTLPAEALTDAQEPEADREAADWLSGQEAADEEATEPQEPASQPEGSPRVAVRLSDAEWVAQNVDPRHRPDLKGVDPVFLRHVVASYDGQCAEHSTPGCLRFANWGPGAADEDPPRFIHRPDHPDRDKDGRLKKYTGPAGERGLIVHPTQRGLLYDVTVPLVLAEGQKQTLYLLSALKDQRVCVVGVAGIRNWQWKPGGKDSQSVPLPDWGHIPLRGRQVTTVPDGDYDTNEHVKAGADALADFLRAQGAEAFRAVVPLYRGEKTGMDDHLRRLPAEQWEAEVQRLLDDAQDSDGFFLDRAGLDALPPVEPLLGDMLNRASITWLSGKFGTYKTFLALAWACCIATGTPWEGQPVHLQGPVVYVAAEGLRGLQVRVRAWEERFYGGKPTEGLYVTQRGMDPRDPSQMAKLIRQVRKLGAVLVVFDTLHRNAHDVDENSSKEMGEAFKGFQRVKDETDATVLVLAHTGHDGDRARGSSAQEDDADDSYVIKLKGNGGEDRSPNTPRVLIRRKSKEGEAGAEYRLMLAKTGPNPFDPDSGLPYITLQDEAEAFLAPAGPEDNVQRIIREMDAAGLPAGLSQRAARGWLVANGVEVKGKATDWNTAHSARQHREAASPASLLKREGSTGSIGASGVLPDTGSSKSAGQ